MFHCPVGVWVIEQHAIILSATVRSPTVIICLPLWPLSLAWVGSSSLDKIAAISQTAFSDAISWKKGLVFCLFPKVLIDNNPPLV